MFVKMFYSMYHGSLATRGPWQALVTFQQMLVLADRNGLVDMTAEVIARTSTIPLDIIQLGIEKLMEADPHSRTPDEEGRRIVLINPGVRDWGWRIVNYHKYRAMRTAEERREYMRNYMRDKRKGGTGNGAWWKSREGVEEMGKSLGLVPTPGEAMNEYKDRIFAEIKKRTDA